MHFRLIAPSFFALTSWLPALAAGRQLIGDPHFRHGCLVLSPIPGKVVVVDTLRFPGVAVEPVWNLAQWHSRFSLEGVPLETLEAGVFQLRNAAKTLVFAPRKHKQGELILAVNASREYAGRARRRREPWPHLLLSQRFDQPPCLTELRAAHFSIEARLLESKLEKTDDYTPRLHAGQFQTFFNIQNLNRKSAGYGDFLYFGIPIYDSRRRIPGRFGAPDQVGKFIMTPPGETFTDESLHDGGWVRIEKDLLPLFRQALRSAWEHGFLQDSRHEADYRIAAMNIGWEVPGILDVSVQVRDLSLRVEANK